jgi:hypothetical protein
MRRERVNDPRTLPMRFDHSMLAQICEMLGDFDLGSGEDVLKMADA